MLIYDLCSIIYYVLFGELIFMGSEGISSISIFPVFTLQLGVIKVHVEML